MQMHPFARLIQNNFKLNIKRKIEIGENKEQRQGIFIPGYAFDKELTNKF